MKLSGLNGKEREIDMLKREFVTCINLQKNLTERIKGRIYVALRDGVFTINIDAGKGIVYKKYIKNNRWNINIKYLTDGIERDYRKFIYKRFFIDKKKGGRKHETIRCY